MREYFMIIFGLCWEEDFICRSTTFDWNFDKSFKIASQYLITGFVSWKKSALPSEMTEINQAFPFETGS